MDIVIKQSIINELVLTSLASCCAPALGVYRVGHVHLSPDRLNSHLSSCTNSSEAVKLFKRANKNVAQTVLQSRESNITPKDDAVAYFISVFSQPDARLQGLPAHLAAVIGFPCSELFSYFFLPMLRHISSATQSLCLVVLIPCTLKFLKLCYPLV
ncbi:hypothetical protein DSO57_1029089 [Entomophthora muscae]|uniref:Uncharacterized protein n=1 Tax=Entomophthora muscae TaxID=34485 RepID=A0ACC2RG17_9FUNG|nr:hypothetical protein DSO57_1029089 [Entomophthora muscae]